MPQIDETPFYCKVANLDTQKNSGELILYQPIKHWADEVVKVCIGRFQPSELGFNVNFDIHGNGAVLRAFIGKDNSPARPIFWLPTWNLSIADNQNNDCLTTQLSSEVLEALKQQSPPRTPSPSWIKVKSSTVSFVRYINLGDMGCALDAVFLSAPHQCYRYNDIQESTFADMLKAPSVGTYFSENIKNQSFIKFDFDESDPQPC